MRAAWMVVLALVVAPAPALAQVRGSDQDRRAELEQQVRRQFLTQVAQRLGLTDDQREQVREILTEGMQERRDLALASQALRIDLMQAVRDEGAPMSRFDAILAELDALRAREREIEQREEAALAEVLDARQRAVFLFMRMQMNERVRQMRGPGGRAGPPGAGMSPGPGPFI